MYKSSCALSRETRTSADMYLSACFYRLGAVVTAIRLCNLHSRSVDLLDVPDRICSCVGGGLRVKCHA